MLFADKRALQTDLKVQLLEIREKELNFYTTNCLNIGTVAVTLAGFASGALMTTVQKMPRLLHTLYLITSVSALGLQLSAVVSTTLLAMLAPGMALRGPDGSMNKAVDSMVSEYRASFISFLLGLVALHFSAISYLWLTLPALPSANITQGSVAASMLTCCLLASAYTILRYIRKLLLRFQLPGEMVTGKFEGSEARHAGVGAGVVSRGEIHTLSRLIGREQHLAAPRGLEPCGARG